jgi:hypothetical protein
MEAIHAVEEDGHARVICGGADSATHPVTWAELRREGHLAGGLRPADGAALVALAKAEAGALARIEHCSIHNSRAQNMSKATAAAIETMTRDLDLVVLAPSGDQTQRTLLDRVHDALPGATVVDLLVGLGDALAASPALAWIAAVDLLREGRFRRAAVLSAGIDGDLGVVVLRGCS